MSFSGTLHHKHIVCRVYKACAHEGRRADMAEVSCRICLTQSELSNDSPECLSIHIPCWLQVRILNESIMCLFSIIASLPLRLIEFTAWTCRKWSSGPAGLIRFHQFKLIGCGNTKLECARAPNGHAIILDYPADTKFALSGGRCECLRVPYHAEFSPFPFTLIIEHRCPIKYNR
jgi:hypothetical protein